MADRTMTRLADDCFAHPMPDAEAPLSIEAALVRISAGLRTVTATETLRLDAALDRTLAERVVAGFDIPPHDNAAVDGYAVRFQDLQSGAETRLPVTDRVAAGHPATAPQAPGTATRIFTGAPMPVGSDTVLMQEDCRLDDDHVVIPPGAVQGMNRRRAGEDLRAGAIALEAGRRLGPADLGIAASVGLSALTVRTRLRVAVFSTGDEVVEPGGPRTAGKIYDANRFTVKALLSRLGCAVTDLGILSDDREATAAALVAAADNHDAIVTSGGVSGGDEDHVRLALAEHGRIDAWRLAVKPGRPVALGVLGGRAVIGLPGNPVAAFVAFVTLARPILLTLAGTTLRPLPVFPVVAGFGHGKKPGRREFLRVRLQAGQRPGDLPRAVPAGPGGSGVLSALAVADGLLDVSESTEGVAEGDVVDYLPFSEVMR